MDLSSTQDQTMPILVFCPRPVNLHYIWQFIFTANRVFGLADATISDFTMTLRFSREPDEVGTEENSRAFNHKGLSELEK
jgi:hypothetical protein